MLGNGKSSRLYRRLVYDLKIAQSVTASQQSQLLASTFEITASPMPGHTLDEIVAVIDQEMAALKAKPVDDAELNRAKNQIEFERCAASSRCWPAPSGSSRTTTSSRTPGT